MQVRNQALGLRDVSGGGAGFFCLAEGQIAREEEESGLGDTKLRSGDETQGFRNYMCM